MNFICKKIKKKLLQKQNFVQKIYEEKFGTIKEKFCDIFDKKSHFVKGDFKKLLYKIYFF